MASPYLNKKLRTLEQARADMAKKCRSSAHRASAQRHAATPIADEEDAGKDASCAPVVARHPAKAA